MAKPEPWSRALVGPTSCLISHISFGFPLIRVCSTLARCLRNQAARAVEFKQRERQAMTQGAKAQRPPPDGGCSMLDLDQRAIFTGRLSFPPQRGTFSSRCGPRQGSKQTSKRKPTPNPALTKKKHKPTASKHANTQPNLNQP